MTTTPTPSRPGEVDYEPSKFLVQGHLAEEGGYWADVPRLPGCVAQAETPEELEANIKDAIEGWLEANGKPKPCFIFEVVVD